MTRSNDIDSGEGYWHSTIDGGTFFTPLTQAEIQHLAVTQSIAGADSTDEHGIPRPIFEPRSLLDAELDAANGLDDRFGGGHSVIPEVRSGYDDTDEFRQAHLRGGVYGD